MLRNRKMVLTAAVSMLFGLSACSVGNVAGGGNSSSSSESTTPAAGEGATVPGQGAMTVPTANAVVARVQNGLGNNASPLTGNFAKSLAQVKTNLPKVSDPTKATGFDQVQLLVYAACSDLTTGTTPKMKSVYGVDPTQTVATEQTQLVAAGVTMLDNYVAKLASQGPTASQVTTALTNLVTGLESGGNTSTIAFMSVCIAANTAGSTLMSF